MLAGLQDFIRTYTNGPDFPLLQDFLVVMRRHAVDLQAFDAFERQWFQSVVLPEFKLWDLKVTKPSDGQWVVEGTLENAGTGTVSVEVAALGAAPEQAADTLREKLKDDPDALRRALALLKAPNASTTISIGAGERKPFRITCPFEPVKAQVDPDVHMLQVRRKLAESALPKA
jgi:hypothetical protein